VSPAAGGALVLGASYRALGVVRSLGRRGIPAWVVDCDAHVLAGLSRFADRRLTWPDGEERQAEWLLALARHHRLRSWTLFPTDDETAAVIARQAARLRPTFLLAAPSWEAMRWAYDKRLTDRLVADAGLPRVRTAVPGTREQAAAVQWTFPAVLKAAIKPERNEFTARKAWRVENRAELLERFEHAARHVPPEHVMVQELIPGQADSQLSYAALCREGEVLVSLAARRTRRSPMDFGNASTYVETIDDHALVEPARALIARLSYTGLVEIEFKRDVRDGQTKLLDINPRVWGWHTLGARAGFDFAYLHWRMLHGQPVTPARAAPGLRWVRMATDVPVAAREIGAGRLSVGGYLRGLRPPLDHAILAADDPLPALLDLPVHALVRARSALRRRTLAGA
jgi:D-aspartate ligase